MINVKYNHEDYNKRPCNNCPLIDPLKIRYKAERVDNGEIIYGDLWTQGKICAIRNKGTIEDFGEYFEIKPETLRIVVEGEE